MAKRMAKRGHPRATEQRRSGRRSNLSTEAGEPLLQLIARGIGLVTTKVIRLRLLWIILVAFLFLSGCVRYDVGIQFRDANHGAITQQIQLSDQLTGVSQATANLWLDQLAAQTKQLGGRVQPLSDRTVALQIPFYNAQDLVTKFDRFFQTVTNPAGLDASAPLPALTRPSGKAAPASLSSLRLQVRNRIFWQRYHLIYDLDLRSLQVVPEVESPAALLINPKSLLRLNFTLRAAGGVELLDAAERALPPSVSPDSSAPTPLDEDRPSSRSLLTQASHNQVSWQLQPGEVNHLEAIFWVPSSIGIGFAVIVSLVIGGMLLKAWQNPSSLIDLPPEDPAVE